MFQAAAESLAAAVSQWRRKFTRRQLVADLAPWLGRPPWKHAPALTDEHRPHALSNKPQQQQSLRSTRSHNTESTVNASASCYRPILYRLLGIISWPVCLYNVSEAAGECVLQNCRLATDNWQLSLLNTLAARKLNSWIYTVQNMQTISEQQKN